MHPVIARIHPAVRTAFFAWLFSRSALWVTVPTRPTDLAGGTPLPELVDTAVHIIGSGVPSRTATALVDIAPWVVAELLVLFAGICVYRFVRTTNLARLAERACWLWFFNPVLAMTALDWGTQIAAATGAIAVAGVVTRRPRLAVIAAVVAVGCRPEFVLLWPAVGVAAWRHLRSDGFSPAGTLVPILAIPAAFSGWIALAWHLAGTAGISMRSLHGDASWRTTAELLPAFPHEWMVALGMLTMAALAVRYLRRFPFWYALAVIPAAAWPLVQVPIDFAAVTIAWALPGFVYLGVATDDRGVGRTVVVGLAVAFVLTIQVV